MLKVKEFKDLGVEFVAGDERSSSVKGHGDVHMSEDMAYGSNHEPKTDHESIISFAWRPLGTLPDNPKFKYEKAAMPFANGDSYKKVWRPLLDQSKKSAYDVDAHVSGEELVIDQLKYDATKFAGITQINDNAVKPVFTQPTANGIDVGSKVLVKAVNGAKDGVVIGVFERWYWVDVAGLGLETYDKALVSKLDNRTPKQKAVDEMIKSLETFENEFVQLNKYEAGKLYDAGYRKC